MQPLAAISGRGEKENWPKDKEKKKYIEIISSSFHKEIPQLPSKELSEKNGR